MTALPAGPPQGPVEPGRSSSRKWFSLPVNDMAGVIEANGDLAAVAEHVWALNEFLHVVAPIPAVEHQENAEGSLSSISRPTSSTLIPTRNGGSSGGILHATKHVTTAARRAKLG